MRSVFIGWDQFFHKHDHPIQLSVHIVSLFYAFLNATIIICIVNLVSHIKKIGVVFVTLLAILITVDIVICVGFYAQANLGIVASIFETNKSEALGMIKECYPIALICFVVTSVIMYFAYIELNKKKCYFFISLILIVCSFIIPYFIVYKSLNDTDRSKVLPNMRTSFIGHLQTFLDIRLPLLFNLSSSSIAYYQEKQRFKAYATASKELAEGVVLKPGKDTLQTIIVVLGESSLRTHYSLYGYEIITTPFLDELKERKSLYYYDAVSPAPITRDAISLSMTFASPLERKPLSENKNLVLMAKDIGYESFWISNQDKVGLHDSFVGMIASSADFSKFYEYKKSDLELISTIEELYDPQKKQIFFLHLKGSHAPYWKGADEVDSKYLSTQHTNKEYLDYDRTIHHTDRVLQLLNNIVEHTAGESSGIIYYYSDHGEIINKGHGALERNMDQFLIPFIAIPFNTTFPVDSLLEKYSVSGIFNTTNFSYVLSETMGYGISTTAIEKAKNDGLYYYHVDGKTYLFDDIKK